MSLPVSVLALYIMLSVCLAPALQAAPFDPAPLLPSPVLRANTAVSTTGFYGLSWSLAPGEAAFETAPLRFELEESESLSGTEAAAAEAANPAASATAFAEDFLSAVSSAFTAFYSGPDRSTTLTGKPNGVYAYRVRAVYPANPGTGGRERTTAWSPVQTVEVRHHSLARAFGFLGTGAVVFLATLALILFGHRRHLQDSQHGGRA